MKLMRFALNSIFVCLLGMMCGCFENNTHPTPVDCRNSLTIHLKKPAVGQINTYRMFSGIHHGMPHAKKSYLQDTLIIRIVAANHNQITLEEYFSEGSKEIIQWPGYINYKDKKNITVVQIDKDTFTIQELVPGTGSKLFFSRNRQLITTPQVNNKATKLTWSILPKVYQTVQYGYLEKFILGNQYFEIANYCIDNEFTLVDGPGYEIIFDENCSILFSSIYGPETGTGYGFELLP